MLKVKKIGIICLAATLLLNVTPSICFAEELDTPVTEEPAEPQVIASKTISAAKCKQIYNSMSGYNGWSATIASIVVGFMGSFGGVAGGATAVAAMIQQMNYNSAKNAFYNGWKSGRGCRMIIYDNAVPTVYAL